MLWRKLWRYNTFLSTLIKLIYGQSQYSFYFRTIQVRDIIQLTYIYLQEEVNIDLSKLMPADTPGRIASKMGFAKSKKGGGLCCGKKSGPKGKVHVNKKEFSTPIYKGSDFFRVYYEDAFEAKDCVVDGYVFRVRCVF